MNDETRLCTFYLDKQMYGIDVRSVQEVIRYQEMTEVPLAPESVMGLINLRGQIVTAIDLRKRLKLPAREGDALPMNVVIHGEDGAISLLVDQIGDVQSILPENYENPPDTMSASSRELIRGTYKLKDRLLLVLNTEKTTRFSDGGD